MTALPKTLLVDTNVPKTANCATDPSGIPDDLVGCVTACVEAIEHIRKRGRLVLDEGDEIFTEYRKELSLSGQPGVGDGFVKWVYNNRWNSSMVDRVGITTSGASYAEFPNDPALAGFDPSDRKYIAAANTHPNKPPILEATDCKWWAWNRPLQQAGISVMFLCQSYVVAKCTSKGIEVL